MYSLVLHSYEVCGRPLRFKPRRSRCRPEFMDIRTERLLSESVKRILEHADMNLMTVSKVRKLAAEDTGLDLNEPANRKVVKKIIEEYFAENEEQESADVAESESEGEGEEPDVMAEVDQAKPSGREKRRVIIDEDSDDSEDKPSNKKRISAASDEEDEKFRKSRVKQRVPESEEEEATSAGETRPKKKGKSSFKRNDDGNIVVCQLGSKRNVAVQEFKGKLLVSIREYYEKDGKQLPSAKGISLTVEQWEAFKDGLPDIQAAIKRIQRA